MTLKRLAPLSGLVSVALIAVAFVLGGEPPDSDAPINEVVSFYTENDSDQLAAGIVLAYGALFFLLFATALRNALRRAEGGDAGASTLSFAGAIVFVVGLAIWASFGFVIGDVADHVEDLTLQTLHVLSFDFFMANAIGIFAFLLGSGIAVVKTDVLPKWLGWVAIVVCLLAITPLFFIAGLVMAIWTLVVSVMLSLKAGEATPGATTP
jgi:hypothetical protein